MSDCSVRWRIEAPNVAVVALDSPPVNALSRDVRIQLIGAFDALEADADVRAIVLTAKGNVFCAGADIKEKAALAQEPADYLRANRLTATASSASWTVQSRSSRRCRARRSGRAACSPLVAT